MEGLVQFVPIIILFVVMYFLLLLPEKKRKKKYELMLENIKVNDDVTTVGGIVGRIISIEDNFVIIESGPDRIKLRFTKNSISLKNYKES